MQEKHNTRTKVLSTEEKPRYVKPPCPHPKLPLTRYRTPVLKGWLVRAYYWDGRTQLLWDSEEVVTRTLAGELVDEIAGVLKRRGMLTLGLHLQALRAFRLGRQGG